MELENENIIESVIDPEIRTNHFSWIYANDEQRFTVMIPLLVHGLTSLRLCVVSAPDEIKDEILDYLEKLDINTSKHLSSGQLKFVRPEDFLLHEGKFDKDLAVKRFIDVLKESKKNQWRGLLVVGDSSEVIKNIQDFEWIDFESRLNEICSANSCLLFCMIDDRQVSGSLITAIIKIHPAVGLGDNIVKNPFYVNIEGNPAYPI